MTPNVSMCGCKEFAAAGSTAGSSAVAAGMVGVVFCSTPEDKDGCKP